MSRCGAEGGWEYDDDYFIFQNVQDNGSKSGLYLLYCWSDFPPPASPRELLIKVKLKVHMHVTESANYDKLCRFT